MKKLLLFVIIFGLTCSPVFLFAQKLFSVSLNDIPQESVAQIKSQVEQLDVSTISLTRNNENKNVYIVPLSSVENSKIIIMNEETENNVVITPVKEMHTEFQLAPFFIEELKQAALGEATQYLIVETGFDFSVKNVNSVSISTENIYIPRFFYGKKEDVKEALPKEREIVGIYKQKPKLILADPDNPDLQLYAAQYEEENSYYVYMYKLPDGTLCTYDENFTPKQEKNHSSSVGNFLEFNLTGELNETQRKATEFALELWSEQLAGTVPVDITVNLYSLGQGILGMSLFPPCFLDYETDIMYPSALWKQLVGYNPNDEWDIFIIMNSDYGFYYGLDGNTNGMDFVTIMIHEITHGLGFGCYCASDGYYFYDLPGIYDCQLYQGLNGLCFTELSVSERAALMVSNNLYSGRPGSNLLDANNGIRVKMYAPTHYSGGSTAHHWDSNVEFPNFMGYAYTYPLHTFNNRKIGILTDMGYTVPEIDPNAVWITFNANGGLGNRTPQPFSPEIAQNLKMNVFGKHGYVFYNWNTLPDGTGTSYQDRASITITENLELYAQWVPATYTLTFYPNLGTVSPTSKQVVYDSPIGWMPTPQKPGYNFTGWWIGASLYTEETIWNFTSDNTFVAKWKIKIAIDENSEVESINIYPNPTTGELTITNDELRITKVEVFDVYGRKVFEEYNPDGLTVLRSYDLTVFPSGIFFLKIETDKGIIMKKIIKQ